jgi:alpha-galactosidase
MKTESGVFEKGTLRISPIPPDFECHQKVLSGSPLGVTEIEICFRAIKPTTPKKCVLSWQEPMTEIHHKWVSGPNGNQHLDFKDTKAQHFDSRVHEHSPVLCLYKLNGNNTILFALSDAMHKGRLGFQVTEDGRLECSVTLFEENWEQIRDYSVIIRVDRRSRPMQECLRDCAQWWERLIPGSIGDLPEGAQNPRYNIRGKLSSSTLEDIDLKSSLALKYGLKSFSFGAGWPEISSLQPETEALDQLKTYCKCLRDKGMTSLARVNLTKCRSAAASMRNKLIGPRDAFGELIDPSEACLDYRYPEVRQMAIRSCEHILQYCQLDGLILNFPNDPIPETTHDQGDPAQDFHSSSEAFSVFLVDLKKALRNLHPDVLIEIHQPSTGPHMFKIANMVRASHCGSSFADNRMRILDIRMLSGRVSPHASPIFWNPSEKVESAAMQLTHTLFAVPQVAQNLQDLPTEHQNMLRFFLSFWTEHRDVILHGQLNALEPQNGFPLVSSLNDKKLLIAVYSNSLIQLPKNLPNVLLLVNGTYRDHVVLEHDERLGPYSMEVRSCTGEILLQRNEDFPEGLNRIDVPINGTITLKKLNSHSLKK